MFTGATDTRHEDVEDQPHNQDWGRLVASWCGIEKIRTNFYRSCFRSFVSRRSDARILFSVADAQRIASSSPGCAAWFSASMTCCSIRASILSNWLRCSVIVSSNPNFTCAWCPLQPISENQSHRMPQELRRRVGSMVDTSIFGCGQNTSYIYSCPPNQTLHGSYHLALLVPLLRQLP